MKGSRTHAHTLERQTVLSRGVRLTNGCSLVTRVMRTLSAFIRPDSDFRWHAACMHSFAILPGRCRSTGRENDTLPTGYVFVEPNGRAMNVTCNSCIEARCRSFEPLSFLGFLDRTSLMLSLSDRIPTPTHTRRLPRRTHRLALRHLPQPRPLHPSHPRRHLSRLILIFRRLQLQLHLPTRPRRHLRHILHPHLRSPRR